MYMHVSIYTYMHMFICISMFRFRHNVDTDVFERRTCISSVLAQHEDMRRSSFGTARKIHVLPLSDVYSRLQTVEKWAWEVLYGFSFFSRLWVWRTARFQHSGFFCMEFE